MYLGGAVLAGAAVFAAVGVAAAPDSPQLSGVPTATYDD